MPLGPGEPSSDAGGGIGGLAPGLAVVHLHRADGSRDFQCRFVEPRQAASDGAVHRVAGAVSGPADAPADGSRQSLGVGPTQLPASASWETTVRLAAPVHSPRLFARARASAHGSVPRAASAATASVTRWSPGWEKHRLLPSGSGFPGIGDPRRQASGVVDGAVQRRHRQLVVHPDPLGQQVAGSELQWLWTQVPACRWPADFGGGQGPSASAVIGPVDPVGPPPDGKPPPDRAATEESAGPRVYVGPPTKALGTTDSEAAPRARRPGPVPGVDLGPAGVGLRPERGERLVQLPRRSCWSCSGVAVG